MVDDKKKKKNKKDSQFIIRINRKVRDKFVDLCNEQDRSAANEIRKFINDYLKKHG